MQGEKTQTHRGGGGVKTEAEMGVMWPPTKECPAIKRLEETRNRIFRAFGVSGTP